MMIISYLTSYLMYELTTEPSRCEMICYNKSSLLERFVLFLECVVAFAVILLSLLNGAADQVLR